MKVTRILQYDGTDFEVKDSLNGPQIDTYCADGVRRFLRNFGIRANLTEKIVEITLSDRQMKESKPIYLRYDDDEEYGQCALWGTTKKAQTQFPIDFPDEIEDEVSTNPKRFWLNIQIYN